MFSYPYPFVLSQRTIVLAVTLEGWRHAGSVGATEIVRSTARGLVTSVLTLKYAE